MAILNNKTVLITVREYDAKFSKFQPIDEIFNWEVCKFLLKNFSTKIFKQEDNDFVSSFQEFKYIDSDTEKEKTIDITNSSFIDNNDFVEQVINKEEMYCRFVENLKKAKFLKKTLLQNDDGSICVFPTNKEYNKDNVGYIESLINWIKEENTDMDLFLLLHDKDICDTSEPIQNRKIEVNDTFLSSEIQKESKLHSLIENNKVFVFVHNSDADSYYKYIVTNPELHSKKASDIIELLRSNVILENCAFSERLGKEMRYSDMLRIINDNDNDKNNLDFSERFL